MNANLVLAVLLAWPPIVVALFRAIGPRRAALVGLLGGLLFLPTGQVRLGPEPFAFPVDKWNVTGLGLLLGALIFDRRSLVRARPGRLDLPMALYYLSPLIGLATGVPGSGVDILDLMIGRGLGWVVPYAMGRLYFGQAGGPSTVLLGLTIAGLSYIPVCLYEEVAGPSRYLSPLIYGTPVDELTTDRLGGWRPVGFLYSGLEVAAWMALSTVMAGWLWLGGWRPRLGPAWAPALALLAATISCRGVYGYILLGIGLASALLTRWTRSRAILVVLLLLPVIYMGLRSSGSWDGAILVEGADLTGRGDTVAFRLAAEEEFIRRVIGGRPAFGFGNYIWHAGWSRWPDGSWLRAFWMGGLVGLAVQLLALCVFPSALALSRPRGRPDGLQASSATWGLAAWCILSMIDGMHNATYFPPTALVVGTLIGSYASRGVGGPRAGPMAGDRAGSPWPVPLLVTVILLLGIEALGRSKGPGPPPPPPTPGVDPRNHQP